MKKTLFAILFILICATASFAQRYMIINGDTYTLNESSIYRFKVEESNILNFYENSTKLVSIPLTDEPLLFTNLLSPAMPENFTATAGITQAVLTWTTPNDGGSPIINYQVSFGETAGYSANWTDIPGSDESTTTHTITGLTDGISYTFEVRAVNSIGTGESSGTKNATPAPPPFEGAGTSDNPYLIPTAEKLAVMRDLINAGTAPYANEGIYWKVIADIDLSGSAYSDGEGWIPIGLPGSAFRGNFDGNNKTISELKIYRPSASVTNNNTGFFSGINEGTVKNLNLKNVNIIGGNFVGGIVGSLGGSNAKVINCGVTGIVKGTDAVSGYIVGGIVGYISESTISNCFSAANVSGCDYVGGIVGENRGYIQNCYSTGVITGHSHERIRIGGIAGLHYIGNITCCYATGEVIGNEAVGGIVGGIYLGTVTRCVALNKGIIRNSGSATSFGRVSAGVGSNNLLFDNAAWDNMLVAGAIVTDGTSTNKNGLDVFSEDAKSQSFFEDLPHDWPFGSNDNFPWVWGTSLDSDYQLPVLYWQTAVTAPEWPEHLDPPFEGAGTSDNPYLIPTAEKLAVMRDLINAGKAPYANEGIYWKVIADIDLSGSAYSDGEGWIPIGLPGSAFRGNFDGNNKTISGLKIYRPSASVINNNTGFFSGINEGTVKNLNLKNVNIIGGNFVGGIVGSLGGSNAKVINCGVTGIVKGTDAVSGFIVGGIVGYISESTISNCFSAANVSGCDYVGGIVGENRGYIQNCYSTGVITGHSHERIRIGGIVGLHYSGSITNCYATGEVIGNEAVGGIVSGALYGTVSRCVALNKGIIRNAGSATSFGRISGAQSSTLLSDNAAWNIMPVLGVPVTGGTLTNNNGLDVLSNDVKYQTFFENSPRNWNFGTNDDNPWVWGTSLNSDYQLPVLYWQTEVTAPEWPAHLDPIMASLITIFPVGANVEVMVGETATLTASVSPTGASQTVTWSSDNVAVATVDANTGIVTGVSAGTVTIRASATDGSGVTADKTITVISPSLFEGAGTSDKPYKIPSEKKLAEMRDLINAGTAPYANKGVCWQLIADISLSEYSVKEGWLPIGENYDRLFCGNFDGQNFTISNLTINRLFDEYIGLFGFFSGGTIKNLNLTDVNIIGKDCVAGVAGRTDNGANIINCRVTGSIYGNDYVGGISGRVNTSTISNCVSTATIEGSEFVGGILGYDEHGDIQNCYTTGDVAGSFRIGGIIGEIFATNLSCCYATGEISGNKEVGGIVGFNFNGKISRCVALNESIVRISGQETSFKRIVGNNSGGTLTNNAGLNSMLVMGFVVAVGGVDDTNGMPIYLKEAKIQATYTGTDSSFEWSFGTNDEKPWIWGTSLSSDYQLPVLYWQSKGTEPNWPTHLD